MYAVISEFDSEIQDLESFVKSIGPVNELLGTDQNHHIRSYLTLRRRFDHSAFIVSLYATFERYAEGIVAEYAKKLSHFKSYEDLPEALTNKYLQRISFLLRSQLGEGRYKGVTKYTVTESLYKCLAGEAYELMPMAVTHHDNNLRMGPLTSLFKDVGISLFSEIFRKSKDVVEWHRSEGGYEGEFSTIASRVEARLDDLVERRNEIAHRGVSDDLIGQEEMERLIKFIRSLADGIYKVVLGETLREAISSQAFVASTEIIDGPYVKGTVVIVNASKNKLYVGQPFIAIDPAGWAESGNIASIQINRGSVQSVLDFKWSTEIGVGLDRAVVDKSKIFFLYEEESSIWAPIVGDSLASS
ncbi:MAE_28990/MAE_18760 family HEPN-like nuclease [Pseudomonas sp. PS02302]|uniref:MAE_28990/MAE_18760 family HEPN-like nuclease n=1 Tax=Pseudomonas sp. PS02302 TaxID=2991428 RepID=UPI00249C2B86|nr:MAE_28990/MAE_18760 family HEPN-like nuclease [Pseudomonas sp. PS02302]